MKKTGGIIATVLTSIFLGIPGLVLAGMGIISGLVALSENSDKNLQNGAIMFMVGGLILILIPIIVGITTLRKKRTPTPAPAPETPIVPVIATPTPIQQQVPISPTPIPPPTPPQPVTKAAATTAVKEPSSNPGAEVLSHLMALNRPTAPYHIIDGKSDGVDLIAEWKIVDAQWKEVFAKASLKKEYRIYLKLDPAKREVRALDREISIETHTGFPSVKGEVSVFKGQQTSFSIGTGYAFTEKLETGQVYKYRFNSNELKKPIQDAISSCGWKYKPVAFGKL